MQQEDRDALFLSIHSACSDYGMVTDETENLIESVIDSVITDEE